MKSGQIMSALTDIDDNLIRNARVPNRAKLPRRIKWCAAIAACFCMIAVLSHVFFPSHGVSVAAYAYESGREITSAKAAFAAGSINDSGELKGHPLMFYLKGDNIDSVRFSCKNGYLNFTDLTEQRGEYGFSQNFTVRYEGGRGMDEGDCNSLLIDWVPKNIIAKLREGGAAISDLPEDLRSDIIVMEIRFANGKSATKAIGVYLEKNGSFRASFDDYMISKSDVFVNRGDSSPIPRDLLYKQGEMTVEFYDKDGAKVLPEANWYATEKINSIVVQWNGRAPEMVQMFFTPTGTETAKEMDFLQTDAISAENRAVISAESLHRKSLMGHLQIVVNFGSSAIKSGLYNVIYEP